MSADDDDFNSDAMSPLEHAQFEAMRNNTEIPETLPDVPITDKAITQEPDAAAAAQVDLGTTTPPDPTDDPNDPDVEVADPKTGKTQKRVSIHKFNRLRAAADAREKELNELRAARQQDADRFTRLDERMKILNEALATPAGPQEQHEEEDVAPDPEKDIFGYVAWQGRQIAKAHEEISNMRNERMTEAEERSMAETYQTDAARFAQTEKGFASAYVYLIQSRDQELLAAGMTDKAERDRKIVAEEKGLVRAAIRDGQSPAQRIFDLAKARKWAPPAAPAAAAAVPAKDPNALDAGGKPAAAAAAKPAAPAAPAVDVNAEIEAIKRGTAAAMSLSNAGGSAPSTLTPEILADMPQEEFNAIVNSLSRERIMQLMGGNPS
jgi:hypothetical protein